MFSVSRKILRQHPARYFHSSLSRKSNCPSCTKVLPSSLPACTNCWHISSLPHNTKHYEIFGLPDEPNPFVIHLPTLKERFRSAQVLCHPDSWASKGANKLVVAQTLSARINEAYQCLLKPLSRAEYILNCHHLPVSEADQIDDIQFISGIMDARETIEDATEKSQVENLVKKNTSLFHLPAIKRSDRVTESFCLGEIRETIQELENLFGRAQWEDAKSAAIRLRYLEGIERAAKRWLDNA